MMRRRWAVAAVAALAVGCATSARYARPAAPVPSAFKETPPSGQRLEDWKPSAPRDSQSRGSWWEIFGDPDLNALEALVDAGNQDLVRAEASFRAARAIARGARAEIFPTLAATGSTTTSHGGSRTPTDAAAAGSTATSYRLGFDLEWEADLFGRIRSNLRANVAAAQASAADLESARLSLHAELAADWFALHGLDAEIGLLDTAVAGYAKALDMTSRRHDQGIVSGLDVAQAETQLETTRVQATDLAIERAQLEHAIAVLVGRPPSEVSIPAAPIQATLPPVPQALPSDLLERRPDIAAAERRVAAANAQVGVASAGFFPRLLLAVSGGAQSQALSGFFASPNRFWSIGPSLVETLFAGGKRRAAREQARASYDAAVASYRQSVLGAFEEVEDELAALRILAQEAEQQSVAVAAAERFQALATNRYDGGITSYLEVVTAQNAALTNERAAVALLARRITASVRLVKALGGGWNAGDLPSRRGVLSQPHQTTPTPATP